MHYSVAGDDVAMLLVMLRAVAQHRISATEPARRADLGAADGTDAIGADELLAAPESYVVTGLLGVGGGFLVVPALVILLRMPTAQAIGTSLLVIAINSGASLAARAGMAEFDWSVIVPFAVAAVLASLFGKRVAGRFSGDTLTRAFAVLLIAVAGLVSAQSLFSL